MSHRLQRYSWARHRFCPRCGAEYRTTDFNETSTSFCCDACDFEFFQNSSPAATAVIARRSRPTDIVLLTRSTPPGQGLLGLPGGFLQYREQPDEGVRREVAEEIGVAAEVEQLLDSYLVDYEFRGSIVSVVELAFLCKPIETDFEDVQTAEARRVGYYDVRKILASPATLAFPEQARALERYRIREGF